MMAMMGFEGFDSTKVCCTREDATLARGLLRFNKPLPTPSPPRLRQRQERKIEDNHSGGRTRLRDKAHEAHTTGASMNRRGGFNKPLQGLHQSTITGAN